MISKKLILLCLSVCSAGIFANNANNQQPINTSSVALEFHQLPETAFRQPPEAAACLLYSLLFGIQQKPFLLQKFKEIVLKNITKDAENHYYIQYPQNVLQLSSKQLNESDRLLHPSQYPLLKVLGHYTLNAMHIEEPSFYFVTDHDTGKDLFFGQPSLYLGKRFQIATDRVLSHPKKDELFLQKDGSISYRNDNGERKKITGPMVLSVGTRMFGGHALSIYFDESHKKWKLYDNLKGVSDLTKNSITPQSILHIIAIGYYKSV